jgi:hypothetical protein
LEFGRLINRDIARFSPVEDLVHVIGHAPHEFAEVRPVGHQPTRLHVFTIAIDRRQAAFLGQLDDQLTVGKMVSYVAYYQRVRALRRDFREYALILRRGRLLERHRDHRHIQSSPYFLKRSL